MRAGLTKRLSVSLVALLAVLLCLQEAQSQRRRNRPSRRVTNPVRQAETVPAPTPLPPGSPQQPSPSDPTLVSTADEEEPQPARRGRTRRDAATPQPQEGESEQMRRTVNELTRQVTRLTEDLTQMREDQRTLVDLERLTRAEQRAENLRAQLREVTDKEFQLQERAAQLDDDLQPDAIERRAALVGSLRAQDVRDALRRSLEREKERVSSQLNMLVNSRQRLESAIASADLEVERLRARVNENNKAEADAAAGATPAPAPTPASTPEPPK